MNTAKQINVMIGLLFVGFIGTLLYFLFDNGFDIAGIHFAGREEAAAQRQEFTNAERGGYLYARNCRSCHGLTGQGAIERPGLPGAPLNDPSNRPPTLPAALLKSRQQRLASTIHCGRVGTSMPPWSTAEGGPLNEFQIEQLVILITSAHFSDDGWEWAVEEGNHNHLTGDAFHPGKHLAEAVTEDDDTIALNDVSGLNKDAYLRIGADTIDEPYEVMQVVSWDESNKVVKVLRGPDVMGSDPLQHEAGAEVYNGPIPPPASDSPLTGAVGTPPCGQKAPAATQADSPEEVALADVDEIGMGDNFFALGAARNPTFTMAAGDSFTITLTNGGTAIHNMATAGPDGELGTDDDLVSDPASISGGGEGDITITYAEAGTYQYQCEFHPAEMAGEIVVE